MLPFIRWLRHGPLRRWKPFWVVLGGAYRRGLRRWNVKTRVSLRVGPYGPFKFDGRFAFSNFSEWGTGHNACFRSCVEASRGANCVLDVGAHIGLVSLPVSSVLAPGGTVHSFEPAETNRALLKMHVEENNLGNVVVVGALIGDSDREAVDFFEQATDSGLNSVAIRADSRTFNRTKVPQRSLDSYCAENGLSPDVIKIDVEGAEIEVLHGADATIKRCRPIIFLSVHPTQIRQLGHEPAALSALVAGLGYESRDGSGALMTEFGGSEYQLIPKVEADT